MLNVSKNSKYLIFIVCDIKIVFREDYVIVTLIATVIPKYFVSFGY